MNYNETIDYLYNAAPAFTKVGASAYKEGLSNTEALDAHANHPHRSFLTIHVAGTNGKGSCSHSLAAILQSAETTVNGIRRPLRVGLFTSPHLVTFRERIRVNGDMIPEQYVIDWVARNRSFFEPLSPSFFELSTAMAFEYFRDSQVDIAVIEVGLGGRLDCTNIISPILSVITNISFDHTQFLGNTLTKIAGEKAGIIKPNTPVVIGETTPETRPVFEAVAAAINTPSAQSPNHYVATRRNAPIIFAEEHPFYLDCDFQLKGYYQQRNLQTILNCLLPMARALRQHGITFTNATKTVKHALANVCTLTGLMGRWQKLSDSPLVICDTGHNVAGWQYLSRQIAETPRQGTLRMVFGMVDDKDLDTVLSMLPKDAVYYFTQAETHRAIPASKVQEKALSHGLHGTSFATVPAAYQQALKDAHSTDDFIFVGGSSYVVADLLSALSQHPAI